MSTHLIRARWVAPIGRPTIENGAVLVEAGQIVDVGRWQDLPSASAEDLGDCVLMPGLVNAHTHLELSDCTPGEKPTGGLEQWLTRMLSRTRVAQADLEAKSRMAAEQGASQSLRFGTTTAGDISRQCHATRPVLRDTPIRVVSFGEVMAMAQRRTLLEDRVAAAIDTSWQSERLSIGISPHSPYSIEPEGYRRCLTAAKQNGLPIATHLAETLSEWEFLSAHTGPLKGLWDAWLTWDEHVPRYPGGPIGLAREVGLLEYGALLAHVNYCSDEELQMLAAGTASVVYCPRTHEFFGHPEHRFREMILRGINVAVGTDSCASSPDLNLVDDIRLLHRRYPAMDALSLWRMATINGARSLGLGGRLGSLEVGKLADLVAIPAGGDDPLLDILETTAMPAGVWIAGQRLI